MTTIRDDEQTRYPLAWPTGWKRTQHRGRARFSAGGTSLTLDRARRRLDDELRRLGARDALLSTNVRLRQDGNPYASDKPPDDPGVAVYFKLKNQPRCLACDTWDRVPDNLAAIEKHIYALRAIDRYGVGTLDQAFAGYAPRLQAAAFEWWIVLGMDRTWSTPTAIRARYTELARTAHPDAGGSHEAMARLTEARDAALAEKQ